MRIQEIGNESLLTASLPVWLSVDLHAGLRGVQAGLFNALLVGGMEVHGLASQRCGFTC